MEQKKGKATVAFARPPVICGAASIVGKKESEGPLGPFFDRHIMDDGKGMENWEQAESSMQKAAADLSITKAGLKRDDIRYLFAGDLLGQLIATSFGTVDLEIPLFGLYGACSTMGEAMSLGAMMVNAGYADHVLSMASSHFATAEKQFRFPLAYGNQRPMSSTWTVTGCGAVVIGKEGQPGLAKITAFTAGKAIDIGARDSMNMGAAMAPAAFHTIEQNLEDLGTDETWYDRIITGDLGEVGTQILLDLMEKKGRSLKERHMDCGVEIYSKETQDTHAGGSGCGCSAVTLCAAILPKIREGIWKRVLFVPTGALLSTVSYNEGQTIPGIAHGVVIMGEALKAGSSINKEQIYGLYKSICYRRHYLCSGSDPDGKDETDAGTDHGTVSRFRSHSGGGRDL
jgi:stage V sporulation protein AD